MHLKKILFIFVLICLVIFGFSYYIFLNNGNNKTINQDKIANKVLKRFKNYEATISTCVISNKNENYYEINQFVTEDSMKMIINLPDNLRGIIIENTGNTLKILNTTLNMEKVYENYGLLVNNSLFLNTIENDIQQNGFSLEKKDDEIILKLELKDSGSTYVKYKELYLDDNYNPKKMIVKDDTKNVRIRIIYTDIKFK